MDLTQYSQCIVNDPVVYLGEDFKSFQLGTAEEAAANKWVSMKQYREKFESEEKFIAAVSNITMLNNQ